MKDSLAMTRAREVNRANGRRLSDSMIDMSQSMQLRMLEIKKENEMAKAFLMKIRASSGSSEVSFVLLYYTRSPHVGEIPTTGFIMMNDDLWVILKCNRCTAQFSCFK